MLNLIHPRTLAAVILTLALLSVLGFPLPFETTDLPRLIRDIVLFAAYLYAARTLFRLPFVAVIVWQRARRAQHDYGMNRRDSLIDGLLRGLLDRRRWTMGVLGQLDRLALLLLVGLTAQPIIGTLLVQVCGLSGALLLLTVYVLNGKFALIVGEGVEAAPERDTPNLPFLRLEE
jgi:hypothetical protein